MDIKSNCNLVTGQSITILQLKKLFPCHQSSLSRPNNSPECPGELVEGIMMNRVILPNSNYYTCDWSHTLLPATLLRRRRSRVLKKQLQCSSDKSHEPSQKPPQSNPENNNTSILYKHHISHIHTVQASHIIIIGVGMICVLQFWPCFMHKSIARIPWDQCNNLIFFFNFVMEFYQAWGKCFPTFFLLFHSKF